MLNKKLAEDLAKQKEQEEKEKNNNQKLRDIEQYISEFCIKNSISDIKMTISYKFKKYIDN